MQTDFQKAYETDYQTDYQIYYQTDYQTDYQTYYETDYETYYQTDIQKGRIAIVPVPSLELWSFSQFIFDTVWYLDMKVRYVFI